MEELDSRGYAAAGFLPKFYGTPLEDAHYWLERFDVVLSMQRWSSAKALGALAMLMDGTAAMWLMNLDPATRSDYGALCKAMREKFSQDATMVRECLYARRQAPDEPVDRYVQAVIQLCRRCGITEESETVAHLIRGFIPPIKEHLLLSPPNSLSACINEAERKQMVMRISGMGAAAAPWLAMGQPMPAAQVAAVQPMEGDPVQREILKQLQAISAALAKGGDGRRLGGRYEFTTDGKPICKHCKEAGHVRRNCEKWNRERMTDQGNDQFGQRQGQASGPKN